MLPDTIAQLCQLIADCLRSQPEATERELITQVETAIAERPQLEAALRANPQMLQLNLEQARGFQTLVQGGIANIGDHYHLSDPQQLKTALAAVLQQLQQVYAPVGIPKNLPDRTLHFVGRKTVMAKVHEQLQVGRVYLQGMGGVGKTELAVQYAWKHYQQGTYPAGICWLRAREQDLGTQIVNFARVHLGLTIPEDLELPQQVAQCWQRWPVGDVLVVVDDVVDYGAIAAYLPPQESRFRVLLTTRSYLGRSMQRVELAVLEPDAAVELLRSLVGEARVDAQLVAARGLAEWLGYLPLGLELVGRYLAPKADLTLTGMQERLESKRLAARALVKRETMTATHESLAAAFELSWQELDQRACQLSYLLSLFAVAPIPWELVEQCLADWDVEELEDTRDLGLVNRSLLQRVGIGLYQLHQLMREFFQVKLEASGSADSWKSTYCNTLIQTARQIPQSPTRELILAVSPSIPHLSELAINLHPWLRDEGLLPAFVSIGYFYYGQGSYTQAQLYFEQCLSVIPKRLGEEHPDVAQSMNNLASLYRFQGRYKEAELLFGQALALNRCLFGETHPDVATNLNNLAGLYESQGRYSEAELLYVKTLALRQHLLGKEHPDVAGSLNNLAALYELQGRYNEAEPLFVQALALRQQIFGNDHLYVASSLNNLAGLYESQGRYNEAEPLYLQALAMRRRLLGEAHIHVAQSLNNLAALYRLQGHYTKAESLFQQALALIRQVLGEDHPEVAQYLNNLALLHQTQGCYVEAEQLFQQALALLVRLGEDHPDLASSLNNLALLYHSQGRYSEAEPLFQQALALRQKVLGKAHPYIAQSLNNLAGLYCLQERYSEAEPLYLQALELRQQVLGGTHPDVATSLNNLAALYRLQSRYSEAEPLYEQALAIADRQLGAAHPNTVTYRESLVNFYCERAGFYKAQGLYDESVQLLQKAIELRYHQIDVMQS